MTRLVKLLIRVYLH